MDDPSLISQALSRCGSTPVLLDLLCRYMRQEHDLSGYGTSVRDTALALASEEEAFAASLTDAVILYLQRDASGWDKAGPEFRPLLEMLAALKRPYAQRPLMDWIDRHRGIASPTPEQEDRFTLAIWTLVHVAAIDSETFVAWWTERAKAHAGEWPGPHFNQAAEIC